MASTTTTISSVSTPSVREYVARVPWYVWCAVLGVTSAMIGGQWDISWHRSIGRDTFWTPAHMAIYLCGVLAGLSCGYLILATTFGNFSQLRGTAVKMWGFEAPLGAFIAAWGGVAMLTSAPFDDWWHSAYGLDVKILSPPHVLLILGNLAVNTGTLILILGMMNRARDEFRSKLNWLFLYIGGVVLIGLMLMIMEFSWHAPDAQRHLLPRGVHGGAAGAGGRGARLRKSAGRQPPWPLSTGSSGRVWAGFCRCFPPSRNSARSITTSRNSCRRNSRCCCSSRRWRSTCCGAARAIGTVEAGRRFRAWYSWACWWPCSGPSPSFLQLAACAQNWFFHTNIFDYNARRTSINVRHVFVPPDAPSVFWKEMCAGRGAAAF